MTKKKPSRSRREKLLHYRLMRRIYAALRSGEWQIRYAKISGNLRLCRKLGFPINTYGAIMYSRKRVRKLLYVDFRYNVLSIVVHEMLHMLIGYDSRPDDETVQREERRVLHHERLIMRHMTSIQAKRLHALIASSLVNFSE